MPELIHWRDEFPILQSTVYMISNSLGAMPRGAARGLNEYAQVWSTRGVRAWEEHWWEMAGDVGNRVGAIIGAPPGSVSMHENVTTAEMVVLSSCEAKGGKRTLVCQEADFPSLLYLYQAHAAAGFELRVVPAELDFTVRLERMLEAIEDSTLLVCMSHVLFRSSYITEAEAIIERAHAVGAKVVLDVYQSAGIVPLDVTALRVDFAVGGCLKWLCGGPGTGFLYTRPDLLPSLSPRFTGWVAHRRPFEFDASGLEPRDDAMRMMNGTPSIPAYYAARAGLEIVADIGVEQIRAKSRRMTKRLFELIDQYGFSSVATRDPDRLAGTVAVMVPEAKRVSRALKARNHLVDYRPGVGIRLSPHFYNTLDELDQIMAEMSRIVRTRDYDVTGESRSLVS